MKRLYFILPLCVLGCQKPNDVTETKTNPPAKATISKEPPTPQQTKPDPIEMVRFVDALDNYKKWKSREFRVRATYSFHIPMGTCYSPTAQSILLPFTGSGTSSAIQIAVKKEISISAVAPGDELIITVQVDDEGYYHATKLERP